MMGTVCGPVHGSVTSLSILSGLSDCSRAQVSLIHPLRQLVPPNEGLLLWPLRGAEELQACTLWKTRGKGEVNTEEAEKKKKIKEIKLIHCIHILILKRCNHSQESLIVCSVFTAASWIPCWTEHVCRSVCKGRMHSNTDDSITGHLCFLLLLLVRY